MKHTGQRHSLSVTPPGTECVCPASAYDALSAPVTESVGYGVDMLAGSVVSSTALSPPDITMPGSRRCRLRRVL